MGLWFDGLNLTFKYFLRLCSMKRDFYLIKNATLLIYLLSIHHRKWKRHRNNDEDDKKKSTFSSILILDFGSISLPSSFSHTFTWYGSIVLPFEHHPQGTHSLTIQPRKCSRNSKVGCFLINRKTTINFLTKQTPQPSTEPLFRSSNQNHIQKARGVVVRIFVWRRERYFVQRMEEA